MKRPKFGFTRSWACEYNPSNDFAVIAVYSRTYIIVIIDSETIDALVSESKSHQRHRRHSHAGSNFPEDFSVIQNTLSQIQSNHSKYKIHHLVWTLSGQQTASPPRGQHPNPPSSNWTPWMLDYLRPKIRVFIPATTRYRANDLHQFGKQLRFLIQLSLWKRTYSQRGNAKIHESILSGASSILTGQHVWESSQEYSGSEQDFLLWQIFMKIKGTGPERCSIKRSCVEQWHCAGFKAWSLHSDQTKFEATKLRRADENTITIANTLFT